MNPDQHSTRRASGGLLVTRMTGGHVDGKRVGVQVVTPPDEPEEEAP